MARQRQQVPPPGGICGPVRVKGQEPEPKGGADRGASVPLINIKPAGSTASIQVGKGMAFSFYLFIN